MSKNQIVSTFIEQKIMNLSYMMEDFFKLRLKKSLNLIMGGKSLPKESLCLEEINIFSSLNKLLTNYINNLTRIQKGQSTQSLNSNLLSTDYILIRFLKEVPQIIGSDLKRYGPFLIDDIAVLPKKNVETLLKHQAIVLINKN